MEQLNQADAKLIKALNDRTYGAPISKPVAVENNDVQQKTTTAEIAKKPAKKVNKRANTNKKKQETKKPKAVMKKKH